MADSKNFDRKAYNKEYRSRPHVKAKLRENARKHYANNKLAQRKRKIRQWYGISFEDAENILKIQGGVCGNKACNLPLNIIDTKAQIDHDHKTGKVRGILCRECNIALGLLKDKAEVAIGLAEYRKKNNDGFEFLSSANQSSAT